LLRAESVAVGYTAVTAAVANGSCAPLLVARESSRCHCTAADAPNGGSALR
jgi:hypothetical protein